MNGLIFCCLEMTTSNLGCRLIIFTILDSGLGFWIYLLDLIHG